MEEFQKIVLSLSMAAMTAFLGMVVKYVKEYLIKKGGEKAVKIAEIVAKNAVEAVEQIAYDKDIKGLDKLTEAKISVKNELEKHNVYLSNQDLEMFVEAAVKRMHDEWQKGQ
ncbi:phage holin [Streptococcus agalactiae]|uniref:phage holin n=1 Tax=Streptococcus agalactiae TaxID=1311 RepID=UPI0005E366C7|nr:phage holin [Streptococcus agalactiae]KLK49998.1 endonuclease [Streptococcus agalactiae]OCL57984.1 phage holin [Streptococcus agalactiae]CNC18191.1 N-acetylmuramoyl-L-alanine amidase [Streptococcus agalactiae]CNK34922.1 N-acetylmuramoyl-L-alanine amidase [Streptococcus agalactiae]HEN9355676.1 phage holin [Streptococcus agalactiae]